MHRLVLVLALGAGCLAFAVAAAGEEPAKPPTGMAQKRSVTTDVAGYDKQHGPFSALECTATGGTPNVKLDCDDPFPNNEPDVEVDPANPLHMVASSNDYGSCCDQFYTTFDGGQSWQTGNISRESPSRTGSDPVTVFDTRHGTTIHTSLNYQVPGGVTGACNGDLVVSISTDGGLHWAKPVVVDSGLGCDSQRLSLFNDKEWAVVDNHPGSPHYGRTYVTWTKFESRSGAYVRSPILSAHSDDGGYTWSTPQEISGSNGALCTYQEAGPAGQCDENQFSVPTVGPDGTVYVAFENEQNQALWEPGEQFDSQYLLVKSADGGSTWSAPSFVAGLEDGSRDYPPNVAGRQTLSGYQVRVNSAGNIVASPVDGRLYLTFSDNRNGVHDADAPVTNTDVFLVSSGDSGATWSAPVRVDASPSDQWFPWADVNPVNGMVGVLYNDRSTSNPDLYDASLAEGNGTTFAKTVVSTAPSNPVDSLFFQAGAPGCETCATFHGDYIGLAYGADGHANMAWTDMREFVADSPYGTGYAQFIYFARR